MFQICRGGKERYKAGAFETSACDDGNDSNKENEPAAEENSIQQPQQEQQQQKQPEVMIPQHPNTVSILLECVGALGMECIRKSLDDEKTGISIPSLANLTALAADVDVDPYCIVKLGRRRGESRKNNITLATTPTEDDEIQVHKTQKIKDDSSPIWTIKTDSLCLVDLEPEQYLRVQLWCVWNKKRIYAGSIVLDHDTLCHGTGDRCPHPIVFQPPDRPTRKTRLFQSRKFFSPPHAHGITLALRYRPATRQDYMFLNDIPDTTIEKRHSPNHAANNSSSLLDHADDLDFKHVAPKRKFLARRTKTVSLNDMKHHHGVTPDPATKNCNEILQQELSAVAVEGARSSTAAAKVKVYRVWPGPDPERVKETKFLSKHQLQLESEKPSRHWVEAGSGDYATVYLEILSCDDLPNMDNELMDGKTDAFCGIVFEDVFVRSSVVYDSLNPRFMPWSTRAFMFHQAHPSSILMLGVFDYDEGPLKVDDPIGRIALHLGNFSTDTMYTLTYPLYHGDTQAEDHGGKITMRLRIERRTRARIYGAVPRFIINTKSNESWRTLRYITRGSVDMTEATVQSVRLYAQELLSYWKKYCYLLDVLFGIFLWRGRAKIQVVGCTFSVWFPIDSIVLFTAVVVGLEFPQYLPSVLLYLLAYCLLAVNYHASHHPSPWRRVRSFFLGGIHNNGQIQRGTGTEETETLERLDIYKANRVTCFLYQFMNTGLNVYRVYSKTAPVDISTVASSASIFSKLYANYLSYGHLLLRMLCRYIRLLRNFVNWKTPSTRKMTMTLLLWATAWALFPFKNEAFFALRICTYLWLGPWIKLIDVFWIHKYYRTTEDLLRDGLPETKEEAQKIILSRPNVLTSLLDKKWVEAMVHSGRIVQEATIKLRDLRERRYGKWNELVPSVDTSRFPSIPFEETSFAQPYPPSVASAKEGDYIDLPPEVLKWTYIPGQNLDGDMMIPRPKIQATRLSVPFADSDQEKKEQ